MPHDRKTKLRGHRSIESKLIRLSNELADDAVRVRADHPDQDALVEALKAISSQLGDLGRSLARG